MTGMPLSVIDCETTGLGRYDRIIELAIVTLDSNSGEVIEEFETLVNPERDVGSVQLHGITAEMSVLAPTFAEIAPVVVARLHESTVVAHNLRFDVRMLQQEFQRLGRLVQWGSGLCTLRLTGLKLGHAVRELGLELNDHHRALSDARAAAAILRSLDEWEISDPCKVEGVARREACRTLRRDAFGTPIDRPLRRWIRSACIPSSDEACVEYFELLDHTLADLTLSEDEHHELEECRLRVGLQPRQVKSMHMAYFESLRTAAVADGVVTPLERTLLESVARSLGIDASEIPAVLERVPPTSLDLATGTRVCFTGSAIDEDGREIAREALERLAASRGLQPVSSVTKKRCNLLVAADRASQSGKARKAREYEIPVVSVEEFLRMIGVAKEA